MTIRGRITILGEMCRLRLGIPRGLQENRNHKSGGELAKWFMNPALSGDLQGPSYLRCPYGVGHEQVWFADYLKCIPVPYCKLPSVVADVIRNIYFADPK